VPDPSEVATVIVRRLTERDWDDWRNLWDAYLRFYRAEVHEETTRMTFHRLAEGSHGLTGFVAEDAEGGVVGIANLVFHPSTWSSSSYCYLEDLYVEPSARGGNTAKELIQAVYAEADLRSASRTYWATQEYNGPARSVYDQVAHRTSFIIYER
jgi:GNAT superfamily N-acetyltransferase